MLQITVPKTEIFNENTNQFLWIPETTIQMEHSLVSLSKWEEKHHKAYLDPKLQHSATEILDYFKCMTITKNVKDSVFLALSQRNIEEISSYINDPMTATTFNEMATTKKHSSKFITSEYLYFCMFSLGVPIECEKWHINRLMTLLKIFEEENKPQKKRSEAETLNYYAKLNAERKRKWHTKG